MKLNPTKLAAALYQEIEAQSKRAFLLAHRNQDEKPILVIGGKPVRDINYDIHFRSVTGDLRFSNMGEEPFAPFQLLFGEFAPKRIGVSLYGDEESPLLEFLTEEQGIEGLISVVVHRMYDQNKKLGIVHGVFLKDGRASLVTEADANFMSHIMLLNDVLTREPIVCAKGFMEWSGINELDAIQ